jgi:hypothetical protein
MSNAKQVERVRQEREKLDPETRKARALEQIADNLSGILSEMRAIKNATKEKPPVVLSFSPSDENA